MLKIGLTGGIASGKSLVASRLRELGAVLVDADVLAREVVEPGTDGLARIVEVFGPGILDAQGKLDRPKLGGIVFQDPAQREVLNGIVHPLVRQAAAATIAGAGPGEIVVQDIPLLVETGQGSNFHLVVVVDAPDDVRLERMVQFRRMTTEDALARMASQATREQRNAAADVVLNNSGTRDELLAAVDALWEQRLVPFAENLSRSTRAPRPAGPVLGAHQKDWIPLAGRLAERIIAAAPEEILSVDHIGSTSVPGLAAKDVIDLQVAVADLETADRIGPVLAAAGYPAVPEVTRDTPKPSEPDPSLWQKRFHANADPGRAVNLHVRLAGSPGWRYALMFRDWLRSDTAAAKLYEAQKLELAAAFAGESSTASYAEAKEPWFTGVAWPRMEEWATRTGWTPPSYMSSAQGKRGQ
ncbi:dephospho-CoA kinase [Paenarthrobacter aurescens]|uniref:Dephospho-CoA kinase n=1 Tax=Paenarthrobacter aurescens TaxID=43663 RepID=A0A4Y3NDW1_PAEAU|nr:dephospho-CoA kinase [Paenarthrobacter aurescens]MDO6143512.1 dephospho-CoA kinase [Paenarthrobacter aurescens]MDO6147360.1 dephospho-CoA kinase [Paenarthrobacter aurescens]MDO6158604.1 dephospho-CoA kinase [Paenarthrobacter aurescens]MDO6162587.1 dephospho-CoA kinase [Paenarthrobacter aurescens]GEB19882.1 dephospho-CoA kinase [Paenarthrobacter aurescens]